MGNEQNMACPSRGGGNLTSHLGDFLLGTPLEFHPWDLVWEVWFPVKHNDVLGDM